MSSSSSPKKSTKQWFSKFRKCRAAKKRSFACSSMLRSTEGTCTMANQGKITRFVSVVSLGAEKNQVPILQASRTFSCVSSIFFSLASQLASHPNRNNQNLHPSVSNFTATWSDNGRTCAGNIQGWSQQISCSPFCLPSWQDLLSCSSGSLAFTGKQNDDRNPSPPTMNPEPFPL